MLNIKRFMPKARVILTFLFLLILFVYGVEGVRNLNGHLNWVSPYYKIVNRVLNDESKYLIRVDLGYGFSDADQRLKMILNSLYQNSYPNRVCFGSCSNFNPDFTISNYLPPLTKYLPIIDDNEHDSNLNFVRKYAEFNVDASLPFYNDGSRGDGLVYYDKSQDIFKLVPNGLSTFTANFNKNKTLFDSFKRKNLILLRGDSSVNSAALYFQYRLNDKYIRSYGKLVNNSHFLLISIPAEASDISYGWYFEDFKENKEFKKPVIYDANSLVNPESIYVLDKNNLVSPL